MSSSMNEPAATSSSPAGVMEVHQLPLDCYPPTDSDDESFVVLENGSGAHSPNNEADAPTMITSSVIDESLELATEALLRSLTPQPLPDMPSFDVSASVCSAVSVDELQARIDCLMDENQKLSDSLVQNNIVMKSQYETLSKWQEDVERVHESHKKKFAETKDYIRKLQEENKSLKKMCAALQLAVEKKAEETANVTIQATVTGQDVSTSMEQVKHVEAQALKAAEEELMAMKETNARQARELETILANMSTLTTVSSLQSVEIFNIKTELTDAHNNNNSLETEAKGLQISLELKSSLTDKLEADIAQLGEEKIKLEMEIAEMTKQMNELRARLEKKELLEDHLKKQVLANSGEQQELTAQLDAMHSKEQKWLEDVTTLKCQLAKMKNSDTDELQHLRIQLHAAQSMIIDLKEAEKVIRREAQLNQEAVDALHEELKNAKVEKDLVTALNEQVALYRGNCEVERSLKIKAVEELNKVSNDLQMVQQRSFELVDEVTALREQFKEQQAAAPAAEERNEGNTPSPPLTQFSCPICSMSFRSTRAVEEHVDSCIDQED